MSNPTSLLIWSPYIYLDIPQPITRCVEMPHNQVMDFIDNQYALDKTGKTIGKIKVHCDELGYPVFVRTAYFSAKFDGYCIWNKFDEEKLRGLLISSLMEDKPIDAICIRKYIDGGVRPTLHNGLPIGSERRYFIIDREVDLGSPYWTKFSVEGEGAIPSEYLDEINQITDAERSLLDGYCKLIIRAFYNSRWTDVDWSVDFMKDKDGKWWLIDMGEAYKSWVPE